MVKFNVLTIFPEMFDSFVSSSMIRRGIDAGCFTVNMHNFRDFTKDKHRRVDDAPFGGGAGMLIAPQSVFDCLDSIAAASPAEKSVAIYMSPAGQRLDMETAVALANYDRIDILCGHYEGVDQRILDEKIDLELSIGDYVLTGGELPAMVLIDVVARHIPGVLGNEESAGDESFTFNGLLEYPQYTRPSSFRGLDVPEVLLSGHYANIQAWQREQALLRTAKRRPDLLKNAGLSQKDAGIIRRVLPEFTLDS